MARKLSEKTYETCKLIAEGHRNKVICELVGCQPWSVSSCKRLYPDVIAEFKGKKMDGTPLEKPAPVEPEPFAEEPEIVEEPAPVPAVELLPKKHSIAELFQEIDKLKTENDALKKELETVRANLEIESMIRISAEKQLAEAKARTSLDKGKLLSLLLAEIDETDDGCFYEYIKGFSHAIDLMVRMEGE